MLKLQYQDLQHHVRFRKHQYSKLLENFRLTINLIIRIKD